MSYQKYTQPVYNGQQQFLVPGQGQPPLIMPAVPQAASRPPPPQITEEVRMSTPLSGQNSLSGQFFCLMRIPKHLLILNNVS